MIALSSFRALLYHKILIIIFTPTTVGMRILVLERLAHFSRAPALIIVCYKMPYHDQTKPEVNRNDRNDMETSNGNTEEIVNDHLQCRPSSSRYQTANNPYTSTLQRPLTASNQQFTNTNATDERRGRGNETNKKRRLNLRNNNEDNGDYAPTTRNIISTNSSLLETCCRAISEKRTNRHEVIINRNDDNDDNDDNATQSVQRSSSPALEAILKGPFQSGKTSIAMDVAYSIASSPHPTPSSSLSSYSTNIVCNTCKLRYSPIRTKDGCAANDTNQLPPKGRGTDNFDTSKNHNGIIKSRNNNDDACCTCCAVAFLIPECKKSTVRFPLRCSTLDPNVGREDGDGGDEENDDDDQFVKEGMRFKERMRLLELDDDAIHKRGKHSNTTTAAAQTRQYRKRSQSWRQSYWKEDCTTTSTILKRIKVKYIKSRTDLILFLASVHSYPPEFKPWGGIIIDDLDYFIQGDDDDNDDVNANNSIDVEGYNGNPSSRTNDITNVAIRSKKTCGGTLDCMKLIQICK